MSFAQKSCFIWVLLLKLLVAMYNETFLHTMDACMHSDVQAYIHTIKYSSVNICCITDMSPNPQLSSITKIWRFLRANTKHDRQCTYNVTLRRVREAIVAGEKQ